MEDKSLKPHKWMTLPLCRLMVTITLTFGTPLSVLPESSTQLSEGIRTLAQYKSNAEQQGHILVGLAADGDITKEDYLTGQSLYAEAKAAFDGWIDQLIFELESGVSTTPTQQYELSQQQAKNKGDRFTKFVQDQFLGLSRRGEVGDEFKSIFASIRQTGHGILQGFSQTRDHDATRVIEQLKGYKWQTFENIKAKK